MNFRRSQFKTVIETVEGTASSVLNWDVVTANILIFSVNLVSRLPALRDRRRSRRAVVPRHDVTTGFLTENELPSELSERFDIVSSFNFIEHLPDPLSSLRELAGLLRSGGAALLEVPNYDMISEFHLFNEFIPDHRFYFAEAIGALLSQAGFQVIECNAIWDSYIISVVARKRPVSDWACLLKVPASA